MKNNRFRKLALAGISLTLAGTLLAACSGGNETDDPNNRRTLRIGTMYGSSQDEQYFRQQYTDLFEFTHGNIDIEIVPAIDWTETQFEEQTPETQQPDPLEKVKEIMTGPNPVDVMILNDSSMLSTMVQENLLKPLDPLMKEDEIDTAEYVPAVIEGIKDLGDGQNLYALAPTYSPSALFYNKKMFSNLGITPPTNGMTWEELFNLARQLKTGEGQDATFGFTFNQWGYSNGYYDLTSFAAPLQLKMFDEKGETMTINTPQWKNVWTTYTDLFKDKVLPSQEDLVFEQPATDGPYRYNPYEQQPFFRGKVAMVIGSYSMISEIDTFNRNVDKFENMEALDWDVVSVPTFAEAPGISGYIYMNTLAAINSQAPNPDDAWEFVKFMNGKEWGKLRARSSYELPSLIEYAKPKEGMSYNMEAFTTTKPIPQQNLAVYSKLYQERPNLNLIDSLANTQYNKVVNGEMSVEEALAEFETKGNELLQKIKLTPTGPIEGVNDDVYGGGGGPILYDSATSAAVAVG
ncbi:ABC transporter substrate-binding protein [Cohnella massiliensis]|uniref:ABC transporter substrate-binding protein n=1 Tax=Cohnella massiliensis TaxID=1816691 RepID=UPI0009B97375|nr:extracellular solute-binding protein [Cohnella massiliensis]